MKKQKFHKTQLSLALTTALSAGLLTSGPTQAVTLDNNDRLGDAGIFQYYTVHSNWQTFFRIINTSDQAAAVKLRFHEAANSREVLDFIVFLSPRDEWVAWTDADALKDKGDGVGIRTNDTSCLYPQPDKNTPLQGWVTIDGSNHLLGAKFRDASFTGVYDDGAGIEPQARMSEGYLEVIGIAQFDPTSDFARAVSHSHTTGEPENCSEAAALYATGDVQELEASTLENVLAFDGFLINVTAGQGAGYDPDVLKDFVQKGTLIGQSLQTGSKPNFDSATPGTFTVGGVAFNQRLADGSNATKTQYGVDINGNDEISGTVNYDLDHSGVCETGETADETDAPQEAAGNNISDIYVDTGEDPCYAVVDNDANGINPSLNKAFFLAGGTIWDPKTQTKTVAANPARIAQNGQAPDAPVIGGVDAVSWELMRNAVINEWAASYTPDNVVSDVFTQWVLTFPTKNYYVDLQDDEDAFDDISPTLQNIPEDMAFAPFTYKFPVVSGGTGQSCDAFYMDLWNYEEAHSAFASPADGYPVSICYETNVLNFNERYETLGLDSTYASTIPSEILPTEPDGSASGRGWARMGFTETADGYAFVGPVGARTGLLNGARSIRYGLPVTGFVFTVYNTNDSANNHAGINSHKYTRYTGEY